jgi:hypothetical protein
MHRRSNATVSPDQGTKGVIRVWVLAAALLAAAGAGAETPGPAPDRLTLGGEVSLAIAPEDPTFFNYTDYDYTPLRLARLRLSGVFRLHDRLALLGEVRSDNLGTPHAHALYLRFRPWPKRPFDLQAGRIPPVFGAFPRRGYGADNFLIGHPLAYQYLTAIRSDALPATAADLVRMRGRGWAPEFPIGSNEDRAGLPLVSAVRWDTGVQARAGSDRLELLAAYTTGTLSSPRVRDDNGGRQMSARVASRPVVGLVLGASAARGAYLSREATEGLAIDTDSFLQQAFGLDVEYSRDYWLVRAEGVWSGWELPSIGGPWVSGPLRARALSVEGRYKLWPGLYAAARVDHLGFNRMREMSVTWDAPVLRVEAGGGYHIRRNLLLKAVYQLNRRDGGQMRSLGVAAGQLLFWF